MNVYLTIVLLVSLCGQAGAAASTAAGRTYPSRPSAAQQKQKKPAHKPRNAGAEENTDKALVKGQAVATLKEVIERSSSIPKLEERALIVSGAAELLWRHDEQYARAAFFKFIDELIGLFEARVNSPQGETSTTSELTAALNVSLKALARKEPALSAQVLERYQKLREEATKGTPPNRILSEKFSLAKESVEVNPQQSASLAAKVIESRVPISFPQYLYDLAGQDSQTADSLYRKSLSILSSGRTYSVNEAILLSAYAFRERMVLTLMTAPGNAQSVKREFGVFTTPLTTPGDKPDRILMDEYLRAAYMFVTSQVQPDSPKAADPAFLGPSYFLVRKLHAYAARLGAAAQGRWQQLEYSIGILSRNAGMDQSTLDYLGGYADRLVADNNVFQFDGGAAAFERAGKTEDKEERTRFLVKGIWNLTQELKFLEVEDRIKEIDHPGLKEQLTDLLNYTAGEAAIHKREWNECTLRASKIKEAEIRLMLLLKGAQAATSSRGLARAVALQYLNEALSLVPKVEKSEDRAKGLMCIAALLSSVDTPRAREVLVAAKNEINSSKAYDRESFEIEVNLPGMMVPIRLADSTFDACLKRVATIDWLSVKAVIEEFDSASARAIAQIAICRAVL
jgi:hypothetical protein